MAFIVLTGCKDEGQTEQSTEESEEKGRKSSLVIKPATLTDREKELITQLGGDNQTVFTVDGKLHGEDRLVRTIDVYEDGESQGYALQSVDPDTKNFNQAIHSFQTSIDEEEIHVTAGSPGSTAGAVNFLSEGLSGFGYMDFTDKLTLHTGETVYLAYLVGTKDNSLRTTTLETTKLPEEVKEADYAVVYSLTIGEEEDLKEIE